jgi:hypothetical protein
MRHLQLLLSVAEDANFNSWRAQLIALAARYRIPANYDRREIAMDSGLMSYGMNNVDFYRQVGIYTGQILKVPSPPISQFSSRLRWSLSSISKRLGHSASNC